MITCPKCDNYVPGHATGAHDICICEPMTTGLPPRFFVAQDQSCHWFMVPEEKRAEWQAWASIDEDDERAWTAPDYARAFDGPHTLSFTDPRFQ